MGRWPSARAKILSHATADMEIQPFHNDKQSLKGHGGQDKAIVSIASDNTWGKPGPADPKTVQYARWSAPGWRIQSRPMRQSKAGPAPVIALCPASCAPSAAIRPRGLDWSAWNENPRLRGDAGLARRLA
jgi:hypothetical protein